MDSTRTASSPKDQVPSTGWAPAPSSQSSAPVWPPMYGMVGVGGVPASSVSSSMPTGCSRKGGGLVTQNAQALPECSRSPSLRVVLVRAPAHQGEDRRLIRGGCRRLHHPPLPDRFSSRQEAKTGSHPPKSCVRVTGPPSRCRQGSQEVLVRHPVMQRRQRLGALPYRGGRGPHVLQLVHEVHFEGNASPFPKSCLAAALVVLTSTQRRPLSSSAAASPCRGRAAGPSP